MNTFFHTALTTEPATEQPATEVPVRADSTTLTIRDFFKNNWWLLGLTGLAFLSRMLSVPWYIESRDGLFFVRALDHYSVVEMRPQWPGYPVYIWVGKLLYLFTSDPVKALHLVSVVASSLTIWPLASLAHGWTGGGPAGRRAGVLASGLWLLAPLSWLGGTEIFSDPLGMLLALTILWLVWLSITQPAGATYLLLVASLLAGLMLGTRLSYVALLLPLVYGVWYQWLRTGKGVVRWRVPVVAILGFGLMVGMWLGWQLLTDGWKFITAGQSHLAGHYSEWGGSATTDPNEFTRPFRFLQTNIVYGLGGWWPGAPLERLGATVGWLVLLGLGIRTLATRGINWRTNPAGWLTLLWILPYSLWILLGNDVDLARYDFPIVGIACLVAALGLSKAPRLAWGAVLVMFGVLVLVSLPQAIAHRDSSPIGVRLADYARTNLNPAQASMLVDQDVSPLIFFLLYQAPNVPSQTVLHPDMDRIVASLNNQNQQIYLTALPGTLSTDWLPVARLCRNQYMESRGPLEVWVYRYQKGATTPTTSGLPCS